MAITSTAWIRSDWIADEFRWYRPPELVEVMSVGGLVQIGVGEMLSQNYPPPHGMAGWMGSFWPFERQVSTIEADLRSGTLFEFRFERWQRNSALLTADCRIVTFAYRLPAICLAGMTAFGAARWRRSRTRRLRLARGMCVTCGHDLRPTPNQRPKCGATVVESPTSR